MTASMARLLRPFATRALPGACLLAAAAAPAAATKIDRVVSPAGIEIWLVQEPSVPLIAMDFAFRGGTSQDPADKGGVASMVAGLATSGLASELSARVTRAALPDFYFHARGG